MMSSEVCHRCGALQIVCRCPLGPIGPPDRSSAAGSYDAVRPWSRLRYRLGRWLIRPHVTNLLEHYNVAATQPDRVKAERCSYIGIGLRYALGVGGWRGRETGPQPWEESYDA